MAFTQAFAGAAAPVVGASGNFGHPVTTGSITSVTGRTVVVGVSNADQAPAVGSVTDNKGNTYTRITSVQNGAGDWVAIFYCKNITGGAGHTVTYERGTNSYSGITAVEFGSIDGTLDVSTTNTGTGVSTLSSGSVTTNASDDLVGYFTMSSGSNGTWNNNGSSTIRSSFSDASQGTIGGLYTRDGVSAGSNNVTGNFNNETGAYSGVFGSFKVSAAAAPVNTGTFVRQAVKRSAYYRAWPSDSNLFDMIRGEHNGALRERRKLGRRRRLTVSQLDRARSC